MKYFLCGFAITFSLLLAFDTARRIKSKKYGGLIMWMFLTQAAISAFSMGCSCAIALYTGKTPL